MKNLFVLTGLCLLFFPNCTTDDIPRGVEVEVRVENISPYNFESVWINPGEESHNYGNIDAGQFSAYKSFDLAYSYAFVEVQIEGNTFTIQPIDYVGETPLAKGNYTYQIDASDSGGQYSRLSLTLVED